MRCALPDLVSFLGSLLTFRLDDVHHRRNRNVESGSDLIPSALTKVSVGGGGGYLSGVGTSFAVTCSLFGMTRPSHSPSPPASSQSCTLFSDVRAFGDKIIFLLLRGKKKKCS